MKVFTLEIYILFDQETSLWLKNKHNFSRNFLQGKNKICIMKYKVLYIAFLQSVAGFVNSGKVPDKEKEHERDYE